MSDLIRGLYTGPTPAAPHLLTPGIYVSHAEYLAYLETCADRWAQLHARNQGERVLRYRDSLLTDCGVCRHHRKEA